MTALLILISLAGAILFGAALVLPIIATIDNELKKNKKK